MPEVAGAPPRVAAAAAAAAAAGAISAAKEPMPADPQTGRVVKFGIECRQVLEWRPGWEPGSQIVRKLALKNMLSHTLRIKYTLPMSKAFLMPYPDTITLSPGITHLIAITFQPWANEDYLDKVEVITPSGSFSVHLIARFQKAELQVPPSIDVGNCTIHERTEKTFPIANVSKRPVAFRWEGIGAPFELSPVAGWVQAGEVQEIRVRICPARALRFTSTALCVCGEDSTATAVRFVATGKFPHLQASRRVVDFGPVMCGVRAERDIVLTNSGPVHATCHIEADSRDCGHDGDVHPPISIIPPRASLSPGQRVTLKCKYTPCVSGHMDLQRFTLSTPAGPYLTLTCRGQSVGPRLSVHPACIDFDSVEVEREVVKMLAITNMSDEATPYQLWTPPQEGVFQFDSGCVGTIPRRATVHVAVRFTPREACIYMKRVLLLVKDGDPLVISIVATAYNAKARPAPLKLDDVLEYEWRLQSGRRSSVLSDSGAQREKGEELDSSGVSTSCKSRISNSSSRVDLSPWKMALSNTSGPAPIAELSISSIDFGECSRLRPPPHQILQVFNRTQAKVCCHWTAGKAFQVFPERAEIAPDDAVPFRVSFRPPHDGNFFAETLECTAAVKAMCSFRTVTKESFSPPVTLPLQVLAHTFSNKLRAFPPKASLSTAIDAQPLVFPPCGPGETQYTTMTVFNSCETPLRFDVAIGRSGSRSSNAALAEAFLCRPCRGVIAGQSLQIFVLKFAPGEAQLYAGKLIFTLNLGREIIEVELRGQCAEPALTIDARAAEGSGPGASSEPVICFRPTSVGSTTAVVRALRNTSPVPCQFRLESLVEREEEGGRDGGGGPRPCTEVNIEPSEGVLQGLDSVDLRWEFSPRQIRRYTFQAAILYACPAVAREAEAQAASKLEPISQKPLTRSFSVGLTGMGTAGALSFDTDCNLHFGEVVLGKRARKCLRILNRNYTDVPFRLSCQRLPQKATEEALEEEEEDIEGAIAFNPERGVVPARAFTVVQVDVTPLHDGPHNLTVVCTPLGLTAQQQYQQLQLPRQPETTGGDGADIEGLPALPLVATGIIPAAFISRVWSPAMSQSAAWRLLRIDDLNKRLLLPQRGTQSDVHQAMMWERDALFQDTLQRMESVATALTVGTALQGMEPSTVVLEMKNASSVPVSWTIMLQEDEGIAVESWVDPAPPTDAEERTRAFIRDQGIFTVMPRNGQLGAGMSVCVVVQYAHDWVGEHRLPALLQFAHGRRVRLELEGTTLERRRPGWKRGGGSRPHSNRSRLLLLRGGGGELVDEQQQQPEGRGDRRSAGADVGSGPASRAIVPLSPMDHYPRTATPSPPTPWSAAAAANLGPLPPSPAVVWNLVPVPLGETEPPVQMLQLFNMGAEDVEYCIGSPAEEAESELELQWENFGFPVLRCLNPSGIIPGRLRDPHGCVNVQVEFTPLEAREYSLSVPIYFGDGSATTIHICGAGFHPRPELVPTKAGPPLPFLPSSAEPLPPLRSPLPLGDPSLYWAACPRPIHPVTLSHEHVDLVPVQSFSSIERIVLMKNTSATETFAFKWEAVMSALPTAEADGREEEEAAAATDRRLPLLRTALHMSPEHGTLAPGEALAVTLSLTATSPEVFEVDYRCQVALCRSQKNAQGSDDDEDAHSVAESQVLASHGTLPPMETAKLRQQLVCRRARPPPRESVVGRMTVSLSHKRRERGAASRPLPDNGEEEEAAKVAAAAVARTAARSARDNGQRDGGGNDNEDDGSGSALLDSLLASSSTNLFVRVSAVVLSRYHFGILEQQQQQPHYPSSLFIPAASSRVHPHGDDKWRTRHNTSSSSIADSMVDAVLRDALVDILGDRAVHDAIRSAPYSVSRSFHSLLSLPSPAHPHTAEPEREQEEEAAVGGARAAATQAFVGSVLEATLATVLEELSANPEQIRAGE